MDIERTQNAFDHQNATNGGGKMLCIAKAYKDEPLKRVVTGSGPRLVYVADPAAAESDADAGVGFPVDAVFAFDTTLYDRLRSAFDSQDTQALWALWQTAQPLTLEMASV